MKKIPLTQGQMAFVDDEDYEWLSKYKWRAKRGANTYYAIRSLLKGEKGYISREHCVNMSMHRMIMNPPNDMQVDHINHNGCDNQKENLRVVTQRENLRNLGIEKTSKYPGVYWVTREKKWMAYIYDGEKQKGLGLFEKEDDAYKSFLKADEILKKGDGKAINELMALKEHSSKYKYVDWREDIRKWRSEFVINGINYYVGVFDDEEEAYELTLKKRQEVLDAIKKDDKKTLEELSKKKKPSSKYKYVSWNKRLKKWVAQFKINKKPYYVGLFDEEYKAYIAAKRKREEVLNGIHSTGRN